MEIRNRFARRSQDTAVRLCRSPIGWRACGILHHLASTSYRTNASNETIDSTSIDEILDDGMQTKKQKLAGVEASQHLASACAWLGDCARMRLLRRGQLPVGGLRIPSSRSFRTTASLRASHSWRRTT